MDDGEAEDDDVIEFIAHRNLDRHQQSPEVRAAKRRERVARKRAEGKSLHQIAEEEREPHPGAE